MTTRSIKCYENYPAWIIFISIILQFTLYLIGFYIVYLLGILWALLYVIYITILEIRLLKKSCVNCYYYDKRCAFGKGKICSLFFKKGDAQKFSTTQITWIEIIPDFLVTIFPITAGIIILISNYDWIVTVLTLLVFLIGFIGNGMIRGLLVCKFCKQKDLGCPAEQLFNKPKKK